MKQTTFYGVASHRGLYKGNLVVANIYFNRIVFRLYVSHRVAQSTNVEYNETSSLVDFYKEEYDKYDRYDFIFDSRDFYTETRAFEGFCKCIKNIKLFVNFDSDNSCKISEEIYRIIG